MTTRKLLTTSVRFTSNGMNVQAFVASLRRVSRVYQNQLHAILNRFVGKELAQLVEGPIIQESTFRFGARHLVSPFSDSSQIFQGNHLIVGFSMLDDALRNDVVSMLLKSSFLPRQPLQESSRPTTSRPCAFRGFLLDRSSHTSMMIPHCGNFFAAETIFIRSNCIKLSEAVTSPAGLQNGT